VPVQRRKLTTVLTATAAGALAALATAAPGHADPMDDAFLAALDSANIAMTNPADAVTLGQQVCPMLSQPGQTAADAASRVADSAGMPLGPATMFTGLAISVFCPGAVASFANGSSQLPLGLLGGF
jgi:hypothetical protein